MLEVYRRRSLLAMFLFAVLVIGALPLTSVRVLAAPARGPQPMQSQVNFIGRPMGIMPDGGPIIRGANIRPLVSCPQPAPDPGCNMTYHGGSLVIGPHTTHV